MNLGSVYLRNPLAQACSVFGLRLYTHSAFSEPTRFKLAVEHSGWTEWTRDLLYFPDEHKYYPDNTDRRARGIAKAREEIPCNLKEHYRYGAATVAIVLPNF